MRGPFEPMWCKYLVKELRTTDLAKKEELFSSKRYQKFDEFVTMLQKITAVAASRTNRIVEVCPSIVRYADCTIT
ncbi:hypothetical protein Aduo_014824 [Ancylostoma duodenale]